jgi:hypothetical protein
VVTLGTNPKHSDIQDNLEQVVKEGFMVKVGTSDCKFVHDKVRKAAYGLIPKQEKNQVRQQNILAGVNVPITCLIFQL